MLSRMAVSQRFIDLLNMPVGALRALARERDLDIPAGVKKWDLARLLSRVPREELEAQSDGYLYAGSTSLSWFRLIDDDLVIDQDDPSAFYEFDGEDLDSDAVTTALVEHAEGDPFSETSRPEEITSEPKLVVAHAWEDGMFMTFAVAKRVGQVIHNFETHNVLEDEFFSAYLRVKDGTFEVRASASRARRLDRRWLSYFAADLRLQALPVSISEGDVRALRDEIDARLDIFRGRDAAGTSVFETRQFEKADTCPDLYDEEEFDEAVDGLEPVAYDLLFDHGDVKDIRMHVSTLNGSIFVRTAVPEATLQYIYDAVRSVKP
jgi:hypothetical protein